MLPIVIDSHKNFFYVSSEKNPKRVYRVYPIGKFLICNCPDSLVRNRECKHVGYVLTGKYERPE